ncbi:MAG: hypothetical protein K0Q50_2524 [Vampirovibrio sp.]|jgi:hypothetical protein|nr:hypothetical protein [Vampirovibrio sp.]
MGEIESKQQQPQGGHTMKQALNNKQGRVF